jgi:hypothetical protein
VAKVPDDPSEPGDRQGGSGLGLCSGPKNQLSTLPKRLFSNFVGLVKAAT